LLLLHRRGFVLEKLELASDLVIVEERPFSATQRLEEVLLQDVELRLALTLQSKKLGALRVDVGSLRAEHLQ
jgi:hypothetical protein